MNVRDVMSRELKAFRDNAAARDLYSKGVALLRQSGIFNMLRVLARPFAIDSGANPNQSAYMAAFVEGYNTCLDDITYFEEMYLGDISQVKGAKADFGAMKLAMSKGYITEEDVKNAATRTK